MSTLEGAQVRRRRLSTGFYRVEVDDGGGWQRAGHIGKRTDGDWGWHTELPGSFGERGIETTLGVAVDCCAQAWLRWSRG